MSGLSRVACIDTNSFRALVGKLFPFVLFAEEEGEATPLITWKSAESRLPWGIFILLGGGFALAEASNVCTQFSPAGTYEPNNMSTVCVWEFVYIQFGKLSWTGSILYLQYQPKGEDILSKTKKNCEPFRLGITNFG